MPQFDVFSYFSQVLCVLAGFFIFYFFILKFYLVHFAEVFKMRQKLMAAYLKKKSKVNESFDIYSNFIRAIFKEKK